MSKTNYGKIAKENNVDQVFVTSDGQPFLTENYAKLHAKQLKNKNVKTVAADDSQDDTKVKKLAAKKASKKAAAKNTADAGAQSADAGDDLKENAAEIIEVIEATEDLELIARYKAAEEARKDQRVTVMDTIAARTEDLTKK